MCQSLPLYFASMETKPETEPSWSTSFKSKGMLRLHTSWPGLSFTQGTSIMMPIEKLYPHYFETNCFGVNLSALLYQRTQWAPAYHLGEMRWSPARGRISWCGGLSDALPDVFSQLAKLPTSFSMPSVKAELPASRSWFLRNEGSMPSISISIPVWRHSRLKLPTASHLPFVFVVSQTSSELLGFCVWPL